MLAKATADGDVRENALRQRDAQIEQLTKAAQVAAKQILEQKALIEQLASKRDDLASRLAEQKLELAKATQIAAQHQKHSTDRQETVERPTKQTQEQTGRISKLEAEHVVPEQEQERQQAENTKAQA